ncbi:hypothetical protein M0R45_015140 [Rubus argutus]|uniref:R13L1/DRL21-like LRR repeat region domain-containing protein n=1 Tax=Rubus argutus TaxID=59490 RepID=A0AAW1XR53_RUBAR
MEDLGSDCFQDGSGVREIESLSLLQGTLRLSKLENVIFAEDARNASLKSKERLEALFLEWSYSETESLYKGRDAIKMPSPSMSPPICSVRPAITGRTIITTTPVNPCRLTTPSLSLMG